MDLFFADDAYQKKPSRPNMGPLVAFGGIHVPGDTVRDTERGIETLCAEFGFPPGEEFKWSPGSNLWMHDNLIEERRQEFLTKVLALIEARGVKALVVIADNRYAPATKDAGNAEIDVTRMFLERVENRLIRLDADGVVIVDQPSGSRTAENKFLGDCLDMLRQGTRFVKPERIALNVLSTPSRLVRLLQTADLITSCTVALVSGEDRHSPPVFNRLKSLLLSDLDRIGGVGVKIHPDFVFANLYHWLLGDSHLVKYPLGEPLPIAGRPYSRSPNEW